MICECEEPTLFPKECPSSCIIRWVAEEGKDK